MSDARKHMLLLTGFKTGVERREDDTQGQA